MLLILFLTTIEAFYVKDISHIERNAYGKANVDVYILSFDIFYVGHETCDDAFWTVTMCDPIFALRTCLLKEAYYGNVAITVPYSKVGSMSINLKDGSVEDYNYENLYTYFNCGTHWKSDIIVDTDRKDFKGKPLKTAHYNGLFAHLLHLHTFVLEYKSFKRYTNYPKYTVIQDSKVLKIVRIGHDVIFERKTNNRPPFTSIMKTKYKITSKCDKFYYGDTCYFYCPSSNTESCICSEIQSNQFSCSIACKRGWSSMRAFYHIKKYNITIKIKLCKFVDTCLKMKCLAFEECFITSNRTASCMFHSVDFLDKGVNQTENTFLFNHIINVGITPYKKNFVVLNLTRIFMTFPATDFQKEPFKLINLDNSFNYTFNNELFIDKYIQINYLMVLDAYERKIERKKIFKVLAEPTEAELTNESRNKTKVKFIYLGEAVKCFSNGLPLYRIVLYYGGTIKFNNPFRSVQSIDDTTTMRIHSILCNFILISYDLGNMKFVKRNDVYIKPYVFLRWNNTKNVYRDSAVVKCESLEYIQAQKTVTQLKGNSIVNVAVDVAYLSRLEGGSYELICFWTATIGLVYSKRMELIFAAVPRIPCMLFYVPTYGSLVQCGHEGYPPDEYIVEATVYIGEMLKMEAATAFNTIRIPYDLQYVYFAVSCTITSRRHWSFNKLYYKKKEVVTDFYKYKYSVSNRTKFCHKYVENVEPYDFVSLNNKESYVKVPIFTLSVNDLDNFETILSVVAIVSIFFMTVASYLLVLTTTKGAGIRVAVKYLCLKAKRINLVNRISLEIRVKDNIKHSGTQEKFLTLVVSNKSSEMSL